MASKLIQCLTCCCKHRRRLQAQAREVRQSLSRPSVFQDSATPLRLSEVIVHNSGYESDYFDARSEASDCEGDCELGSCGAGLDSGMPLPQPNQAEQLLHQVKMIERRCRGNVACDDDEVYSTEAEGDVTVECILREDATQFWVCHTPNCPVVTACAYFFLANTKMEDACDAIRLPKERLTWDTTTLRELEVIGDGDIHDPASGQIVRCVVIAPRPLKDREMLQRRWQLPLPNGGQAFLLRSFDDSSLLPDRPDQYVRAFTHLSGYLLRPLHANGKNGVELTMISRSDIGGLVPMWVQNIVRRLAKREIVKWAKKLHSHCDHLAVLRAERARTSRQNQQNAERRMASMEMESMCKE